jgi:hypothetical protein
LLQPKRYSSEGVADGEEIIGVVHPWRLQMRTPVQTGARNVTMHGLDGENP